MTANRSDKNVSGDDSTEKITNPAHVVHLVSALHEGGIERLLLAMAPYWDRTRFSMEVWCLNIGSRQAYLDTLESRGVQVHVLGRLERGRIEPGILWHLMKSLVRRRIAVIHSHTPYPLVVAMLARLFLGSRIVHIHHQHLSPPRYQILSMRTLGRIKPPDRLIAVSPSLAADVSTLIPHLSCRITVIFNGIEIPKIGDNPGGPLHHLFTAVRLTAQKNVELLLTAMQKIKQQCPDATLTILGDGELRHSLEEKTRSLGIEDRVTFLGFVLDPEKYYAHLGIFVLPSLYEGFGLATVEAMAWSKPCVATEVTGTVDILKNEENGLLVPSNQPDAMANAILRMIKDPALARRLAHEAKRTVLEFDIKKTVDKIQSLYTEQLKVGRGNLLRSLTTSIGSTVRRFVVNLATTGMKSKPT